VAATAAAGSGAATGVDDTNENKRRAAKAAESEKNTMTKIEQKPGEDLNEWIDYTQI